jgi:phenylacetate-coenzyme A ligase PaaK-like adenylate-forming protein
MTDLGIWGTWSNLAELWWARHGGGAPEGLAAHRFAQLVRYAREYSPFYRRLYEGFPDPVPLEALPVARKADLMAHFDDWCTDRRVRLRDVLAFLADRGRGGERFLGGLWVWKSSGTSGTPGIFLQDLHAMCVYDALVAAQLEDAAWGAQAAARLVSSGGRAALVVATGDHFASIASWERVRRAFPGLDARSFPVMAPLPELAAGLDEYRPAFLAGYPSVLELLAEEQLEGRLAIAPALAWSGGEALTPAARARVTAAFGCDVMNEYGASECLSIAHECREGWQHLHSEWVVLEGVDRDGLPSRPGELSHTALLTNLANWVQPVIRYDLGDRILRATGPCACGDPHPAFRVEGRTDDVLAMRSARGATVRLLPLALSTVVEEAAGAHRFQVAQTAPDRLSLRIAATRDAEKLEPVRRKVAHALRAWLATQSLENVRLAFDAAPPRRDAASGKLRSVVVEAHVAPSKAKL